MSKRKAEAGDAAIDMEAEESSSPPQQEKQAAGGFSFCGQLRSSARVLRRKEERKESETAIEDSAAATIAACVNGNGASSGVDVAGAEKPRRTWGQWSAQDKATFFEAINEYGKNFVAIQSHFQNKAKKASSQVYKNKVQIRTFYYRTWHKIAKYITFPEVLKKSSRELYGLINYGELRKKVGSKLDEKVGSKLQELVFRGHTTFRLKGKTIILRTPICRALKGINLLKTAKTVASAAPLPTAITLDLKPLRQEDFFHVHAKCYQNPHVHVKVSAQHRMGSVISLLEGKWTPREDKLKSVLRAQADTGQDDPTESAPGSLWLVPPPGAKVRPLAAPAQPVTSATLSLASIQDKLSGDQEADKAKETVVENDVCRKSEVQQDVIKEEREEEVGWSSVASSNPSVGDLFLMLGSRDSRRIELCYTWKKAAVEEDDSDKKSTSMSLSVLQSLSRLAATELARKQQLRPTSSPAAGRSNAARSPALAAAFSPKTGAKCELPLSPLATPLEYSPIRKLSDAAETAGVGSTAGVEFRRPSAPPMRTLAAAHPGQQSTSTMQSQAFRKQLSLLLPRFCNRRGRTLTRKNVVSRQLVAIRPLHPASVVEPDGRMKLMLSPASSMSSQIRFNTAPRQLISTNSLSAQVPLTVLCPSPALVSGASESMPTTLVHHPSAVDDIPSISIPESLGAQALSPTGSSLSMFENSLTEMPSTPTRNDHFLDSILENSSSSLLQTPPRHRPTPPTSPSRAVTDSWMPDLSLSSFLSLGESPVKNLNEDSSHSTGSEVDRQLLSMMTESSVDFTAKFARLASHVSDGD